MEDSPVSASRAATKSRTPSGNRKLTARAPPAGRSSVNEIPRPRLRKATCRKRSASMANEHRVVSKISVSGQKAMIVLVAANDSVAAGRVAATPRAYSWTRQVSPRCSSAVSLLDRALATKSPVSPPWLTCARCRPSRSSADLRVSRASRPRPPVFASVAKGPSGPLPTTRTPLSWVSVTSTELSPAAGQGTVDGPAHDLEHHFVQPAFAGRANPHTGPFPNRFPPLQLVDPDSVVPHSFPTHEDPSHAARQTSAAYVKSMKTPGQSLSGEAAGGCVSTRWGAVGPGDVHHAQNMPAGPAKPRTTPPRAPLRPPIPSTTGRQAREALVREPSARSFVVPHACPLVVSAARLERAH